MKVKLVSKLTSAFMAVVMTLSCMPAMLAFAAETDTDASKTAEAVALLEANTGKTLADIAKENGWLRYDWGLSYSLENNHLQGLTVDDELKYMYLCTGDYIIKLDMSTGFVVGSITNFGKSAGMTEYMGAHMGCLDYYDGRVYCGMIAANPSAKLFVLSIDASKIDRLGVDAQELEEGVDAILLKDHIDDYRSQVTDKFTNWPGLGNFTMTDEEGHRFGCGGVDAITFGTYPGDTSGKMYLIAGYSTFKSSNNQRQDNNYTVLRFYPLDSIWDSVNHKPIGQNIRYTQDRIKSTDYGENEALSAEKSLFVYTGNIDWGSQNLEFEEDSKDIVAYCYGPTDFWTDSDFPPRVMFVIDGSVAPTEKVLELGQNNTLTDEEDKAYVKAIADAYSDDSNGDGIIDDSERLTGPVGTLKCHCGDRDSHSAGVVGDAEWGDTGVKKAEYPICGSYIYSRGDEGVAYIGKGSDGAGYFYTRGGSNGREVNLWKRTIEESGKYTYTLVEPDFETAKPILHYSMDSEDIQTVDGVKYMKNTLDADGRFSAVVEGTAPGKGADGSDGGALSFNAWNYPASVDQMYLSDETIRYIDTKIHNQAYSYSFWAKMATDANTDGNFNPFIGFYREDGTYAGVFEQRWRGEMEYIVNGIGAITPGNPGKAGASVGSKDNGWHFYTVTEMDGAGTVYCDGIKKGSYNVQRDHLCGKNISDFIIGGGDAKIWYDKNNRGRLIGSVDELTIYSGVLTADEVKTEYNKLTSDGTRVTAAAADISDTVDDKLRASYDLTADKDSDLTVDVGYNVSGIAGLTKDTDFTAAGNSVTFKAAWLAGQSLGIVNLDMGDKQLELTVTDKTTPVINYSFSKNNVTGSVVKDSGVYGIDAVTTADSFDYNRNGTENGALMFDGYDYKNPDYVKLSDENAAWLNSVLKDGYTMNFWANAAAENGSVMSMAGLYAADARPLGVVESYELSSNSADNSSDGKMVIQADTANGSVGKANAANSTAAVSDDKVNVNEWHMYTVSYDKQSNTVKLYVDGVNKASSTVNDDIIGNIVQLFVGHQYKRYYNATGTRDWLTRGGFKGAIDGISVYNSAIGDEAVANLYSSDAVINGRIIFKDDFEGYSGELSSAYVKEAGDSAPDLAVDGDNHSLHLNLPTNSNIQVRRKLGEELTDGVVSLSYRVKPAKNTSTMLWLMGEENADMLRLPMFVADGRIAITDDGGLDTTIGSWDKDNEAWYDVYARLNLNTNTVDVAVKKDGAVIAQKNNIHTTISKVGYIRTQMYSGQGDSYFDDIIIASVADDGDDNYIINDNFEEGIMDYTISSTDVGKAEIVKDGTNSVLNLTKLTDQWSVSIQKDLDKAYTDGTIHLSYKIKPCEGAYAQQFNLALDNSNKLVLPEFSYDWSNNPIIKIDESNSSITKANKIIGSWQGGEWYDVTADVDLDAGTYDISVNKSGADASSAVTLSGDYFNLKQIKQVVLYISGTPEGTVSIDDVTVWHEKTSSSERLVFKDNFELRNGNSFEFWNNWDYTTSLAGNTNIVECDGSYTAGLSRGASGQGWETSLSKPFADSYTSGVVGVSYSVKPGKDLSTMLWMGPSASGWEDSCLVLPQFNKDSKSIKVFGSGIDENDAVIIGTYTEGTWYDVYAEINLNSSLLDITVKNRATGEEFKKSGIKTSLNNVAGLRMQVWGSDGNTSYFDDIVVKHSAEPALPYYQDFEDGTTGAMITENTTDTETGTVVDNPDGSGKVYKLSGDNGAPQLKYYLNDLSKGKMKIEADIKTGAATCSTLLALTHPDNKSTQMVLFGNNNDHPGIWADWAAAKYADTRKENAWYHVKLVVDADNGTLDSWVTDSDGQVYSITNYNYAANVGTTTVSSVYFQIWTGAAGDTSYIDNIQLTVPAGEEFDLTYRTLSDNGEQVKTLDALKSASNPAVNIGYNNTTAQDKTVWVIVNSYKDNQLISCKPQIVTIGADETEGVKLVDIADMSFAEADYVNVLIWESEETMIPLFEALKLRMSATE